MSYRDHGECPIDEADEANIPVNIWIGKDDDEWLLHADNYMPRKSTVHPIAFNVHASDRQTLEELVEKYVVPLYENALKKLKDMKKADVDGTSYLYFWDETK